MNKLLSLVVLAGGIVLIVLGLQATNSLASEVSRFFTHSPTEKSVWLLIGGLIAVALGGSGLLRRSRTD